MQVTKDRNETLACIHAGSPYLSNLLEHHAAFSERIFKESPDQVLQEICTTLSCEGDITARLRHKKAEAALLIAIADISGLWDVVQVTAALTKFADAAVRSALPSTQPFAPLSKLIYLHTFDRPDDLSVSTETTTPTAFSS